MVPADDAWLRAQPIDPDRFAAFYRAHARDGAIARTTAGWVVVDRRH